MSRLLILSCSQRKRPDPGLLPAIERYDGPTFRVLRKYAQHHPLPCTYILSARWGLIHGNRPVPYYDQQMTQHQADALSADVRARLAATYAEEGPFADAFVCASGMYRKALQAVEARKVTYARGGLGRQVAMLYDWLYGEPPPVPATTTTEPVTFRGVELRIHPGEVLRTAETHLQMDPDGAARFQAWYVPVGRHRVAPKWLVSVLTGFHVATFRTTDARRVLTALGLEVCRA